MANQPVLPTCRPIGATPDVSLGELTIDGVIDVNIVGPNPLLVEITNEPLEVTFPPPVDTTLTTDCNNSPAKRVTDPCLTTAVNDGFTSVLTELRRPRYDIEVQTCSDGVDEWLLVIDKNELIAGLPTISYTNLTTATTQAARPANLLCASPEEIELVPLKGCLNGVTVNGFSAIRDKATSAPSIVWTLWLNPVTGILGAADSAMTTGECAAPKLHLNAVHWRDSKVEVCTEGKAWYDEATGKVVRVNLLDGSDVTADALAIGLTEGACPELCEIVRPVGVIATWG